MCLVGVGVPRGTGSPREALDIVALEDWNKFQRIEIA